jgi:pimeloyl-ACP methyl ester carboxylesterase
MDQLGIQRAHLVGYSLGGFLSLKFAVMHPERVRTLSVLGAGWVSPEEKDFQQALESIARRLRAGQMVGPLSAVQPEARNQPGLLHRAFVMLMTGYFNDPLALASVVEALPEITVSREELGLLNAPICVIIGERVPSENVRRTCAPTCPARLSLSRELIMLQHHSTKLFRIRLKPFYFPTRR